MVAWDILLSISIYMDTILTNYMARNLHQEDNFVYLL